MDVETLAEHPQRWPESGFRSARSGRAGGKGTAFKPCTTPAVASGDRTAHPSVWRGCHDRGTRPSPRGPPDHRRPPPRPGRRCATARPPQDDRRIGCPRGRTVRARRVTRGRRKSVRRRSSNDGHQPARTCRRCSSARAPQDDHASVLAAGRSARGASLAVVAPHASMRV